MSKKYDLPAMPFYFGDWMKAPEVRALELSDRMIWFEMLGFMWESTERGYLTINNKPIPEDMLARMLGLTIDRLRVGLLAMKNLNVYSIREDGAIYSRRMVKDNTKREKYRESGKKGGNPKLVGLRVGLRSGLRLSENENEDEIENKTNILKEGEEDLIQVIWIETWGRNPSLPEREETETLIKKIGAAKVKKEMRRGNLKGFKNYGTFLECLDETGTLILNDKNKGDNKPTIIQTELTKLSPDMEKQRNMLLAEKQKNEKERENKFQTELEKFKENRIDS